MPAHRTQNSRHLRVEANPVGAPPINIISPTPQTFVFSANTMNAPNSETSPFSSQATRSLPNLFTTFHASPSGEYNSFLDPSHAAGSHTSSMFTTYRDSGSTSFFASPVSSIYGPSPPESPAGSTSPSPPPGVGSPIRERRSRSASRSSPGPYPFPLPPHSNGQVRTQPPRPPNPWICFRNVRSAQYKELNYPEFSKSSPEERGRSAPSSPSMIPLSLDGDGIDGRRPRQADLSKQISLEWKSLSDEEKAPYIRMSEEAKLIHARIYPGYKYQPRRKPDSVNSTTNSKTSSADSPSKKGKSKKNSGKEVKISCKAEEKPLDDDIEIEAKPLETVVELIPENAALVAPLQLPETSIPVATTTIETEEQTGDPTKDWTWLPEQTLLPISWEPDQDTGNVPLGDIMNPLDANVDDTSEHDEIEFGKPFYVSFPSVGQALEEEATHVPFFPFTSEPESENSLFSFSNYDFQGSFGFHLDGLSDISHLPDISGNFDSRRDSYVSTDGSFNLDIDQPFLPLTEDNGTTRGLNLTTEEINNLFTQGSIASAPSIPPAPRRASVAHPTPSEEKIPIIPPSPRRSSFAFASTSAISKSPDGHLLPPIAIHRPFSRSRANTLPAPPSPFSQHDSTYVRSIPIANFGADGNVTTSVLIPLSGPRYDLDYERDLEEYNRAMGLMGPPPSLKSKQTRQCVKTNGSSFTAQLGGNEFSFESDFDDIIDVNGHTQDI